MITRRRLLQSAAVGGAAVAFGAQFSSVASFAQTPTVELEHLNIATTSLPPSMDPQVLVWIASLRIYPMIFDTLVTPDWKQGGKLVPSLATGWTQVDDLTLDVTLRDDVVFHNGTPMTATDVKYTFDRSLQNDPTITTSGVYGFKQVEIIDDYTVRFVTEKPNGGLLLQFAQWAASIVPAAHHAEVGSEAFGAAPVGTGPYKVTEFVLDSKIEFARHDAYFGGAPAAAGVTVTGVPEVSTRIAALLNGDVDLILDLPPDQIETVQNGGDFKLDSSQPLNVNVIDIPGQNAPMDKKEIRQALSLAIDRQTIVEELFLGNAVWPSSIQSTLDPLYIERPKLEYNPEKAKELLAQAGYAGEEISFVVDSPSYYPLEQEWGSAIVAMWSEIGVNVKQVNLDVNERVAVSVPDSEYHAISDSAGVYADTDIAQGFDRHSAYYPNMFGEAAFPEIIAKVQEAEQTVNADARAQIYQEAIDLINDEVPMIVLWTINRNSAMKSNISWAGSPDFGINLRIGNFSVAQ